MKMLHPFMPFITEELYQQIRERQEGASIMRETINLCALTDEDKHVLQRFEQAQGVITGVRGARQQKNIPPKTFMTLEVVGDDHITHCKALGPIIRKMAFVDEVHNVEHTGNASVSFLVGTQEYGVPMEGHIDLEAERKAAETEIKRLEGFLAGIRKKLQNEKFVNGAPAQVVELERKKEADTLSKIATLKRLL